MNSNPPQIFFLFVGSEPSEPREGHRAQKPNCYHFENKSFPRTGEINRNLSWKKMENLPCDQGSWDLHSIWFPPRALKPVPNLDMAGLVPSALLLSDEPIVSLPVRRAAARGGQNAWAHSLSSRAPVGSSKHRGRAMAPAVPGLCEAMCAMHSARARSCVSAVNTVTDGWPGLHEPPAFGGS